MARILKWVLDSRDVQVLIVPKGTEFLSAANQNGAPCVWGKVLQESMVAVDMAVSAREQSLTTEPRTIAMYGTGHSFSDDLNQQFIGTVLLNNGALVVHIYEVK